MSACLPAFLSVCLCVSIGDSNECGGERTVCCVCYSQETTGRNTGKRGGGGGETGKWERGGGEVRRGGRWVVEEEAVGVGRGVGGGVIDGA